MQTPQEEFWAGEFGNDYIERNRSPALFAANLRFFSRCLKAAGQIGSCIELGANIGLNLEVLKLICPGIHCTGIEINPSAAAELRKKVEGVEECSILDWEPNSTAELTLAKTVLIHMPPARLSDVYERLYQASERLILICEYYNPAPVEVCYRGHSEKLFKRDFAGEMLDMFPDLTLLDYGFSYHRDLAAKQDDISWFLLTKK